MSSVGLDVGGTFLKAAWLDPGGLHVHRRAMTPFLDTTGLAREIDPDALMGQVIELLDEVIGEGSCERIFITGQMAGLAFVDENGHPVSPLLSWQDTRFDAVDEVRKALSTEELRRLGDGLRVGLPLVTLATGFRPESAKVASLISFVAGALVGGSPAKIQATDAASLGLLDVGRCRWEPAALSIAGLKPDQLPVPTSALVDVGYSARYDALVASPVGDQQAALFGVRLRESELSVNIATGCQVSRISSSASSPLQLRPYLGGNFLQTATHLPAGRLLGDALRQDLGRAPTPEEWRTAMVTDKPAEGALGRAIDTIASACLEAAVRLGSISEIVFSGGVAQGNPVLRHRITDVLGVGFRVHDGNDASLSGLRELSQIFIAEST